MALTLHGTVADNTAVLDRRSAKPLIINGNMAVAQRGTSVTGVTGVGYNAIDRMKTLLGDNGTWTHTQDTDVPTGQGFANSWKLDNTTADTSVASGAFHTASYFFEGQDLQLLKKGTSSAEKVTISFWIKTTVTGTYVAELYDADNTRHISQAYTVSSSNTWEKKVLSFAGDTTGALDDDNANSLILNLWLGAGSDYTSGTLATSWASVTTANRAVGQVNGASSTSNNIYITGLQMEVGDFDANSIAPFQHESYGDSLVRCQRYCQVFAGGAASDVFAAGQAFSTVNWLCCLPFHIPTRAQPSVAFAGAASDYQVFNNVAGTIACATISATNITSNAVNVIGTVSSGLTAGNATMVRAQNSTATITVTSEL